MKEFNFEELGKTHRDDNLAEDIRLHRLIHDESAFIGEEENYKIEAAEIKEMASVKKDFYILEQNLIGNIYICQSLEEEVNYLFERLNKINKKYKKDEISIEQKKLSELKKKIEEKIIFNQDKIENTNTKNEEIKIQMSKLQEKWNHLYDFFWGEDLEKKTTRN